MITSSMPGFGDVKNYTWIMHAGGGYVNAPPVTYPPGVFVTRLAPLEYHIWLRYNETTWVDVAPKYLATDNPPYALPSPTVEQVGFLNTGLPTMYVAFAVIAVLATLAAGTTYLLIHRQIRP